MAKIMTVRPTDELKNKLQSEAAERGLTLNALIIQILWEWLKKYGKSL